MDAINIADSRLSFTSYINTSYRQNVRNDETLESRYLRVYDLAIRYDLNKSTSLIAGSDAITINGYMGADGIEPFAAMADKQGKGVFVLVRTSNPSAGAIQDFADADGMRMYDKVAEVVADIGGKDGRIGECGYSNIGMVVGGTAPEVTTALREKYDKVWFLVPGYGSQGASGADCVRFCKPDGTGALINASRSIIYAYEKPKYKEQFGDDWKRCIEQAVIDAKVDLANAMQTLL